MPDLTSYINKIKEAVNNVKQTISLLDQRSTDANALLDQSDVIIRNRAPASYVSDTNEYTPENYYDQVLNKINGTLLEDYNRDKAYLYAIDLIDKLATDDLPPEHSVAINTLPYGLDDVYRSSNKNNVVSVLRRTDIPITNTRNMGVSDTRTFDSYYRRNELNTHDALINSKVGKQRVVLNDTITIINNAHSSTSMYVDVYINVESKTNKFLVTQFSGKQEYNIVTNVVDSSNPQTNFNVPKEQMKIIPESVKLRFILVNSNGEEIRPLHRVEIEGIGTSGQFTPTVDDPDRPFSVVDIPYGSANLMFGWINVAEDLTAPTTGEYYKLFLLGPAPIPWLKDTSRVCRKLPNNTSVISNGDGVTEIYGKINLENNVNVDLASLGVFNKDKDDLFLGKPYPSTDALYQNIGNSYDEYLVSNTRLSSAKTFDQLSANTEATSLGKTYPFNLQQGYMNNNCPRYDAKAFGRALAFFEAGNYHSVIAGITTALQASNTHPNVIRDPSNEFLQFSVVKHYKDTENTSLTATAIYDTFNIAKRQLDIIVSGVRYITVTILGVDAIIKSGTKISLFVSHITLTESQYNDFGSSTRNHEPQLRLTRFEFDYNTAKNATSNNIALTVGYSQQVDITDTTNAFRYNRTRRYLRSYNYCPEITGPINNRSTLTMMPPESASNSARSLTATMEYDFTPYTQANGLSFSVVDSFRPNIISRVVKSDAVNVKGDFNARGDINGIFQVQPHRTGGVSQPLFQLVAKNETGLYYVPPVYNFRVTQEIVNSKRRLGEVRLTRLPTHDYYLKYWNSLTPNDSTLTTRMVSQKNLYTPTNTTTTDLFINQSDMFLSNITNDTDRFVSADAYHSLRNNRSGVRGEVCCRFVKGGSEGTGVVFAVGGLVHYVFDSFVFTAPYEKRYHTRYKTALQNEQESSTFLHDFATYTVGSIVYVLLLETTRIKGYAEATNATIRRYKFTLPTNLTEMFEYEPGHVGSTFKKEVNKMTFVDEITISATDDISTNSPATGFSDLAFATEPFYFADNTFCIAVSSGSKSLYKISKFVYLHSESDDRNVDFLIRKR